MEIPNAVISVPHYFNEAQRSATKQAAEIAGFNVLRIVNEPVCAALAYNVQLPSDKILLVLDFGGGTLDCSLLQKQGNDLFIIASEGDTSLGGEDITGLLMEMVEGKFKSLNVSFDRNVPDDMELLRMIRERCEQGKRALSARQNHIFIFNAKEQEVSFSFTQADLARIAKDIFDRSETIIAKLLKEKNVEPDLILLVGGSSRLVEFKSRVTKLLKKEPLKENVVDIDLAIAMGAAVYAEQEVNKSKGEQTVVEGKILPNINDVITHSIGVAALFEEAGPEKNDVLLPKGTSVGTSMTHKYRLQKPNQTSAKISILEGEMGEIATSCKGLFEIMMSNLPPDPALSERIEVKLEITDSGILKCWARDLLSNNSQFKEVKHSTGLSDDEVQRKKDELSKLQKGE